jgi:hypothetical protein
MAILRSTHRNWLCVWINDAHKTLALGISRVPHMEHDWYLINGSWRNRLTVQRDEIAASIGLSAGLAQDNLVSQATYRVTRDAPEEVSGGRILQEYLHVSTMRILFKPSLSLTWQLATQHPRPTIGRTSLNEIYEVASAISANRNEKA